MATQDAGRIASRHVVTITKFADDAAFAAGDVLETVRVTEYQDANGQRVEDGEVIAAYEAELAAHAVMAAVGGESGDAFGECGPGSDCEPD